MYGLLAVSLPVIVKVTGVPTGVVALSSLATGLGRR